MTISTDTLNPNVKTSPTAGAHVAPFRKSSRLKVFNPLSVDRLKDARRRLVDRVLKQGVVFHHVPKCGGTSFGRALRKRYILSQSGIRPEETFQAYKTRSGGDLDHEDMLVAVNELREQILLYHLYCGYRCVSAHVPYFPALHREFGDSHKFVTVLRDPVERFLSHYAWSRRRPQAHAGITLDFEDFLKSSRAERMGACYATFFSGDSTGDVRSEQAISSAVRNLRRFDVVGRMDDMKGFGAEVGRVLDVRLRIGHENRAASPFRYQSLDDAEKRTVERLCAPDIEIWNRIFG